MPNNFENELDRYLETALKAVKSGSKALIKYWGKLSNIREKTFAWDLVTEADKESETLILKTITKTHPEHCILAEESGYAAHVEGSHESPFLWVVDPLDGTTNYTHQYPMVSISIALLKDKQPILGVVYNPIFKELFIAVKGRGGSLNGRRIQVSKTLKVNRSLLSTGFAYDRRMHSDNNYAEFCRLTSISQGVRRGGSAALDLAYVAAGRLDGYWERGLQPWDLAAGILLVEEAGGRVTSYSNEPFDLFDGRVLATNGVIHQELSALLVSN